MVTIRWTAVLRCLTRWAIGQVQRQTDALGAAYWAGYTAALRDQAHLIRLQEDD